MKGEEPEERGRGGFFWRIPQFYGKWGRSRDGQITNREFRDAEVPMERGADRFVLTKFWWAPVPYSSLGLPIRNSPA